MYNPANYPPPTVAPRQGMAIASFVIAIVSLATCGGVCIGPILGLIFGIVAMNRANRDPIAFGGKSLAIAGIVVSLVSPGPAIVAAIAVPNLIKSRQAADEASAISSVRTICSAEATYQAEKREGLKERGFADLPTLAAEGFIDYRLAAGLKSGYQFSLTEIDVPDMPPMFDVTAVPVTAGPFGSGTRSYGSNETLVVYSADGAVEIKGTPENRIPANGRPLQ